jgi:hypothetical protein
MSWETHTGNDSKTLNLGNEKFQIRCELSKMLARVKRSNLFPVPLMGMKNVIIHKHLEGDTNG